MEEEKLTLSQIEIAIQEKKDFLVTEMAKLGEVFEPIQEELALQVHKVSGEILELFKQKKQLEEDQKIPEEQRFSEIEQKVLHSLPKSERQRIAKMHSGLQEDYGKRYEISYKQAIMKLHNKEVVIGPDSVQFLYAHKELYKQELQLDMTKDRDIFDHEYEDFDGKNIQRRELKQKVLDNDNKHYHLIWEAKEQLKQEGKYIATEENTFNAILKGFKGTDDQIIKAIQFLTGFVGCGIISLEKDKNDCRHFLKCDYSKPAIGIRSYVGPNTYGSLLVAKDC